jgi:hypothetical protein
VWLWAAGDRIGRGGRLTNRMSEAIGLVVQYLLAVGHRSRYGC